MKDRDLPELIYGRWYMISVDFDDGASPKNQEFPVRYCLSGNVPLFDSHYFSIKDRTIRRFSPFTDRIVTCRIMSDKEVAEHRKKIREEIKVQILAEIDRELERLFG